MRCLYRAISWPPGQRRPGDVHGDALPQLLVDQPQLPRRAGQYDRFWLLTGAWPLSRDVDVPPTPPCRHEGWSPATPAYSWQTPVSTKYPVRATAPCTPQTGDENPSFACTWPSAAVTRRPVAASNGRRSTRPPPAPSTTSCRARARRRRRS